MTDSDSLIGFNPISDPPGVEIVDQIEQLRYRIHTFTSVSPVDVDTDQFRHPVDRAVELFTKSIVIPAGKTVCVRNTDGEMLAEIGHLEEQSFQAGRYVLDLGTQIKTFINIEGPLDVSVDLLETRIELDDTKRVSIGAVCWHDRPAATVTTTGSPVDMMAAISTFGSALKTTSPERSFPSNRGHPPAIRLGNSLDIPPVVEPPDTGISIEIPPTYEAVYAASPLAYYLSANVEVGSTPKLITEDGFEHSLETPYGLGKGVERVLKQVFLLDCVTRTEGVYEIELRERNLLEPHLNFDFAALYDRPLAEQVETYLSVPYSVVADSIPEWRLTVQVQPDAETVEQIPYVVDDLAIVRSTTGVDGT
ncbi:MAG: hypothetical protein ACOCR6_03960, partial [archaeon]